MVTCKKHEEGPGNFVISVSSTKIRKMIATEVHSNEPAAAGAVRKLMAHSQKTAELSYVRVQSDHHCGHRPRNREEKHPCKSPAKEEAQPPTEYTTPVKEAIQEAAQSPTASMASTISRGLTSEEKDAVDLLFSDEISTKTGVEQRLVRSRLTSNLTLQPLVTSPKMVKRVVDRVRYQQSKQDMVIPYEEVVPNKERVQHWLISEFDESWSQPSDSSGSRRTKWSDGDTISIVSGFSRLDGRPTKSDVEREFKENPILRRILDKEGFQRCYDKVKSLLKAKKL